MTRKYDRYNDGSLTMMRCGLFELFEDTEERPRMSREHREARKLIRLHLGAATEDEFVKWQKQIDAGLRSRDPEVGIEDIIIPAQDELRKIYEKLFQAIFGRKPRRGE